MSGEDATGGLMLLGMLGMFGLPVIGLAAMVIKGWAKVERFDRNRAIERDIRNQVADADKAQQVARKLLRQYEK